MRTRVARTLSFLPLIGASLCGQARDAGILTGAGSNRLEWRRHYDLEPRLLMTGTADDTGALWLISRHNSEDELTKIGPGGELIHTYKPTVPLSPIEYIDYLTPAVSGPSVGLLANVISGGRDQTHEAAFFLPVGSDGLGKPARISRGGPQFQTMIGIGRGEFIVAGDQEPLTLLKLDSTGRVLWRRSFSSKLVLPTVSAGSSGTIFLVSKNGSYNLLQVFDPAGRVVGSTRVAAEWADVAADAGGGCSVLFSNEWKGKDRTVYLLTFDRSLRRVLQVATPLRGQGGRTYHLVTTPRGHLVIGEGAVLTPPSKDQRNIVAEFDSTGALLWQQEIAALSATIAPFASGFYAVRKLFLHKGIDVEKYAYK